MLDNAFNNSVFLDETGTASALFENIDKAIGSGAKSLLILACDENGFEPEQVDNKLQSVSAAVFGGIFPQIIFGQTKLEKGSIVYGLPVAVDVFHVEKLSDSEQDYYDQIEPIAENIQPGSTLITLVDGLSSRIAALLESLYGTLGSNNQYLGGGAGSLSFEQKPCLFSNAGLRQDCAQITQINTRISLGIEHGWHPFAGPFLVTGAQDNTINSLDYRPAFELYREVVEADSKQTFNDSNFFDIAKAYPFGLDSLKDDVIVRDPLLQKDNDLVCVGEVPGNHMIHILKGEADNLLAASAQCVKSAVKADTDYQFALLFDCISRVLFLEERFQEEVDNIYSGLPDSVPLIGVLSLGEIADSGNTCLEFFNKTTVLGAFVQN
jgi:hypothetical protein